MKVFPAAWLGVVVCVNAAQAGDEVQFSWDIRFAKSLMQFLR